jgi:hypothetical protein
MTNITAKWYTFYAFIEKRCIFSMLTDFACYEMCSFEYRTFVVNINVLQYLKTPFVSISAVMQPLVTSLLSCSRWGCSADWQHSSRTSLRLKPIKRVHKLFRTLCLLNNCWSEYRIVTFVRLIIYRLFSEITLTIQTAAFSVTERLWM